MTKQADFAADHLSFDEGLRRLTRLTQGAGFSQEGRIITSRDKEAVALRDALRVSAVPSGFRKWQLPVYLKERSQLYLTVAEPDADVPEHSHPEGDGIRFIVSGSVQYRDHELTAGDWMFIPAGVAYSMRVGHLGATMCYCYCCCCAGARDLLFPGEPVERSN
jgi:mannose-6-phosphate isomerase-like protein (cupin superfamily)